MFRSRVSGIGSDLQNILRGPTPEEVANNPYAHDFNWDKPSNQEPTLPTPAPNPGLTKPPTSLSALPLILGAVYLLMQ